jgi:superfamily II DNA or RNA helicase
MNLRPYQSNAVEACLHAWGTYDRLLGVAATGAGKTVIGAHVFKQRLAEGPALFIAHREELLSQAIDKLYRITNESIGLERAQDRAHRGHKIVVASVQSLHAKRLAKWERSHFKTAIIDETHRATAATYQGVLNHFDGCKTLGITATPDRADQKSLGAIFEHIAFEIPLIELIQDGYLAPIKVEQIPLKIDLSGVALDNCGDLDVSEAADRLEPYLGALVDELVARPERKTLVFLPLVRISDLFSRIARSNGLAAEHIDGESPDRREILARFHTGETRVLSCAMLLSEGYDEPSVDCICMMRPTQSRTLYCQCLGRGFRICEGKKDLLVLDPLWLSSEHSLVKPANLVAASAEEADEIMNLVAGGESDLLGAKDKYTQAKLAFVQEQARKLAEVLDQTSKRARFTYDPLEVASVLGNPDLAAFEPIVGWHAESPSEKQSELLIKFGVNPKSVQNRGHAHLLLNNLLKRRKTGLATFRQLRQLIKFRHPSPHNCTFEQASAFLDERFGTNRQRGSQMSFV